MLRTSFVVWNLVLKSIEIVIKILHVFSPTFCDRGKPMKKLKKKRPRTIGRGRRVKAKPLAPPEIYVKTKRGTHYPWDLTKFSLAHLRIKAGYLYLCWRDQNRVRTYYLGKAKKSSPTESRARARDRELGGAQASGAADPAA
jgi:hypothetical protein